MNLWGWGALESQAGPGVVQNGNSLGSQWVGDGSGLAPSVGS